MKRLFAFLLMLAFFAIPAAAEDSLPEEYYDFSNSIPDDVAEMLPEEFFSGDISALSETLLEITSPKYVFRVVLDLFSGGFESVMPLFLMMIGMLALSALLSTLVEGLIPGELNTAVNYAISVCISGALVGMQVVNLSALKEFFGRLTVLMNSMIPIMGALYLSGGNTTSAALAGSSLLLEINLIELGVSALVIPSVCACLALTLADSLSPGESKLGGISASIKRTLTFVFGLCSTLLMSILSAQSILASASDSAGARAVKYIAGNMIPVVGSTVGDTLRTLSVSVRLMRTHVGIAGIAALSLLILPTLVRLFLTRFAYNTAAAIGELLGCRGCVKIMREIASLYGYIIAASVMSSVLCIFALTLFAMGRVAIGG